MQTQARQSAILLTAMLSVVPSAVVRHVYAGAEETSTVIDSIRRELTDLETQWRGGGTREYYERARNITKAIMTESGETGLQPVADKLFQNLISKNPKSIDVGADDLSVMKILARYQLSEENVSIEEKRVRVE